MAAQNRFFNSKVVQQANNVFCKQTHVIKTLRGITFTVTTQIGQDGALLSKKR